MVQYYFYGLMPKTKARKLLDVKTSAQLDTAVSVKRHMAQLVRENHCVVRIEERAF